MFFKLVVLASISPFLIVIDSKSPTFNWLVFVITLLLFFLEIIEYPLLNTFLGSNVRSEFSRELIVTGWRSSKSQGGQASIAGKTKTTLQFLSILLMLWPTTWGDYILVSTIQKSGWFLFWPSLFYALYSAILYIVKQIDFRQN